MSMRDTGAIVSADEAVSLRMRSHLLVVLELYSGDPESVDLQLREKVARGADFFRGAPLLIDCEKLADNIDIDWLLQLSEKVKGCGFIPVGILGAPQPLAEAAREHKVAVWPTKRESSSGRTGDHSGEVRQQQRAGSENGPGEDSRAMVVRQTVRSGQRIYAKGRDLIVMSSVNTGAEIMADGHIHVYGSLRGRALAGVAGRTDAAIFCHDLKAELIAVAGYYSTYEDIPADRMDGAARIFLEGENLRIDPLNG